MNAKHTPGPPVACEPGDYSDYDGQSIVIIGDDRASAPDLLTALKEVVALSDRKHNAWDKANAAIARAEGRTS